MNQLSGKFEVQIGEESHTCHLSMNAFRILCERENLKFTEMDAYLNDQSLTAITKVIYYGILNNIYSTRGKLDSLPEYEFFASQLLSDVSSLERYTELIGKAFAGEALGDEEAGKK